MGRRIATQYGDSTDQKQRVLGRVDPFCIFAVLPMVLVAALFFWGGIAIVGVLMIVLAGLVVLVDSWANRPVRRDRHREER